MLDYQDIQFHPEALNPAGLSRRLAEYDQADLDRRVAASDDWTGYDNPPGRPPNAVPAKMARLMLDALEGHSIRAVARKFGVKKSWLCDVHRDGRLQQMADGN